MNTTEKLSHKYTDRAYIDLTLINGGAKLEARGHTAKIDDKGQDLPDSNAVYFSGAQGLPKVDTLSDFMGAIDRPLKWEADLRMVLAAAVRYYNEVAVRAGTPIITARLRLGIYEYEMETSYEAGARWRAVQDSITITNTKVAF